MVLRNLKVAQNTGFSNRRAPPASQWTQILVDLRGQFIRLDIHIYVYILHIYLYIYNFGDRVLLYTLGWGALA